MGHTRTWRVDIHLSEDDRKISIGSKDAAACSKGDECLPHLTYIDTVGQAVP